MPLPSGKNRLSDMSALYSGSSPVADPHNMPSKIRAPLSQKCSLRLPYSSHKNPQGSPRCTLHFCKKALPEASPCYPPAWSRDAYLQAILPVLLQVVRCLYPPLRSLFFRFHSWYKFPYRPLPEVPLSLRKKCPDTGGSDLYFFS